VGGAIVMTLVILTMVGITIYLVGTLARSIQNEKRTKMRLWKNFGLSLGFCLLFLVSWVGQAAAEYQTFVDEQREHNEPVEIGDFAAQFSQSTLENWQSEFLQLFSFTVMAAVLIHKGSAESKDSDDRIEGALRRIEDQLGTNPTLRDPHEFRQGKDLHVVPDGFEGWALIEESTSEPEGYYDTQADAIAAGRELAAKNGVALLIHGENGKVRDEQGAKG
jgi:hypothetical protein